jgi:hypothetical protein
VAEACFVHRGNRVRGGAVKAAPSAGRENTLEGEQPQESYEPGIGLNRRRRAMDSRVEQSPEGEGRLRGLHNVAASSSFDLRIVGRCCRGVQSEGRNQRQEGTGRWRRRTAAREEKGSEGDNPTGGSGMKQGR